MSAEHADCGRPMPQGWCPWCWATERDHRAQEAHRQRMLYKRGPCGERDCHLYAYRDGLCSRHHARAKGYATGGDA